MKTEAFFSDESENYISPSEPEPGQIVRILFRMAVNEEASVEFVEAGDGTCSKMFRTSSDRYFDYYEIRIEAGTEPITYYFRISDGKDVFYYDRSGPGSKEIPAFFFSVIPGFHTPDWAKGAVMYQIFVDRFCRGDGTNDVCDDEYIYIGLPVRHISDWNEYPSAFDVGYFYGGDLSGVWNKLKYLSGLGVEVIYFNPLFVSPSNHKYDTQDYEHIDPHISRIVKDEGNLLPPDAQDNAAATKYICRSADPENLKAADEFFASFMKAAHELGLKVILDGVFNHCGSFNKWMDREKIYRHAGNYAPGAFESPSSPYVSYFAFADKSPSAWPDNKSYDGWWGHETLPKLNYENSDKLENSILGIVRKWLLPPYRIDGWRLDVAADLGHSAEYNHSFWKKFRRTVKEINPDALILAEHYGDPAPWLNGEEWDTVMNYDAFMEPVSWFLTGMEKHSDRSDMSLRGNGRAFWEMMKTAKAKMPMPSVLTAMNELSNHDHSRFLTRTNHLVGRLQGMGSRKAEEGVSFSVMRQAILMQMTWPGAPTIYYGDEAGLCGWTDPDNRRTYPWGSENMELLDYHRYVNLLHKKSQALKKGSLIPVLMADNVVSYGRVLGREKVLVVVYTGEQEAQIELPVRLLNIAEYDSISRRLLTYETGYNEGTVEYVSQNGILAVGMTKNSAAVFVAG
jgi:alpha-glucosidase